MSESTTTSGHPFNFHVYPHRPDCAVCGKPYTQHHQGLGVPVCPIIATYRPKEPEA